MDDAQRDELLIRLDERIDTILKRLSDGDRCIKDHEKRIGKLEGFQNTILALAGAVALAVSVAGNYILSHFRGA